MLLLVWIIGFISLAGEIALARLVAPYWGSGTVVWSVVIALVLLALALGYWVGGRAADRRPSRQALAFWLLPGVVILLQLPYLGRWLLPGGAGEFFLFVLLGSLSFFFLGATTPWVLRIKSKSLEHSGELAGKLFAASTVGSFLGTLLCALVLLPEIGTGRTFFLLGGLGIISLGILQKRFLTLLPLAFLLFLTWSSHTSAPGTLWEGESAEQHLRVREASDGTRLLEINDGRNIQSIWKPGQKFSNNYWDSPLFLWATGESKTPGSLLVLGNGAGITGSAWIDSYNQRAWGIELDPQVTELGRRYFQMDNRLRVLHGDARRVSRGLLGSFSVIFLDTYDESFIPFHLLTEEFFMELQKILDASGVIIINIHNSKDIDRVLGKTTQSAFRYGLIWHYDKGNNLLVLSQRKLIPSRIINKINTMPPELRPEALRASRELQPLPRTGELWTDDLAPAERYSD